MRNEKTERIFLWIGTVLYIGCIILFIATGKGSDQHFLTKLVTTSVVYAVWVYRIISRNKKNQILLFDIRKANQDSIGDALQDRKILKLLKSAVYEFNAQNKERSIAILESTWSQCDTYSDQALTGYLLAFFLYAQDEYQKAETYLDRVLGMRPYFRAALNLREKIEYSQQSI